MRKSKNKFKNILSVAALEKGKRLDRIIKAVSNLTNTKLTIIGEGTEKQSLINLAKSLNVNLEIKKVDHKDISREFSKADLFVSASESYYAFEIVLIEALATNLPVVANNDEIRKEIIGNAGILSDPEIIDNFSQDIKEALKLHWGDNPRKQAEKFSWDVVSQKYINTFRGL